MFLQSKEHGSTKFPPSPQFYFIFFDFVWILFEFTLIFSKKRCCQSAKIHPKKLMLDHYTCPIPMTLANWITYFLLCLVTSGCTKYIPPEWTWTLFWTIYLHMYLQPFCLFKYGHSKVIQFIRTEWSNGHYKCSKTCNVDALNSRREMNWKAIMKLLMVVLCVVCIG
jgi:hypothetical protein